MFNSVLLLAFLHVEDLLKDYLFFISKPNVT